jgi:hypothetical protein
MLGIRNIASKLLVNDGTKFVTLLIGITPIDSPTSIRIYYARRPD